MKKQKRTLVIHPKDVTTDFLIPIYKSLNPNTTTILTTYEEVEKNLLATQIKKHDRIIMLGHGFPGGLWGFDRLLINDSNAELLRNKELVGIWCHANQFFEKHGLLGVYSGMIISEPLEAIFYSVPYTDSMIHESNTLFTKAVTQSITSTTPIEVFRSMYRSESNPVMIYNQDNFFHAYEVHQLEDNEQAMVDYNAMEEEWEMDNYNEIAHEQQ